MRDAVFISWAEENGRSEDISAALEVDLVFASPAPFKNPILRHMAQAVRTAKYLWHRRPDAIIVMLPPTPLLLVVVAFARITGSAVIADLHTGFFSDPKWRWATRFSLRLLRSHSVIVTNRHLEMVCKRADVARVIVAHDLLPVIDSARMPSGHAIAVCPVSYSNDEPISEIIGAAARTPNIQWVLTGRAPESIRLGAPRNVTFSGFLNASDYRDLVSNATFVAALTTRAHTMQRAGYESVAAARPVLTSDFPELHEYFGAAAEYCDATPSEIASAATRIIENIAMYEDAVRALRASRSDSDARFIDELKRAI